MPTLVAGYLRVSTEEQAEQNISIPAQKSRIASYCHAQGWELYDFYVDDGYSGKDLERPAIKRLIREANDKLFKAVVVIKLDRLSRRQKDVLYLLEDVFDPNGVGFKSVSEPFDTTTPFGKAAIGMMAVFAQLERETIVERVKEAKKEAAKQGRFMGGPPPFGYQHNPATKGLDIDELQAETIRLIFTQYLAGDRGYQYIADLLTEKGVPAPTTASFWHRSTVKNILHNPIYAGFIEHKGKLNSGKHLPIITPEVYYKAQELQGSRSSYNPDSEPGLLTGIIYCGECGARVRLKKVFQNYAKRKNKVEYYICYSQDGSSKTMIKNPDCSCGYKRAEIIDDYVVHHLRQYSLDSRKLEKVAKDMCKECNQPQTLKALNRAKKELDSIKKRMEKWYNAFELDAISADDLTNRIKDLRDRRNYLETQIEEYEAAAIVEVKRETEIGEFIQTLRDFPSIWKHATNSERRSLLHNMVQAVKIYKDDSIDIVFNR